MTTRIMLHSRIFCSLLLTAVVAVLQVPSAPAVAAAATADAEHDTLGRQRVSVERRLAGLQRLREDLRLIVRYADGEASPAKTRAHAFGLEARPGVQTVKALEKVGMAIVTCTSQEEAQSLMIALAADAAVENVMPDTMVYLDDDVLRVAPSDLSFSFPLDFNATDPDMNSTTTTPGEKKPTTTTGVPEVTVRPVNPEIPVSPEVVIPDDPLFSDLWGMKVGDGIDAVQAWTRFTGDDNTGAPVIVGVIDTGIDYKHEDLVYQMWHNPAEIPDNGIDDDGNGFVDDVHGANFVDNSGDPMDDNVHGTHCSGTIAAIGNNSIGVTGVAWGGVRLMGLKFLAHDGSGRTSDAIRAIDYALANGARITSNSWGGGPSSSAMRVAIERAADAGMLFIAAAGNSGSDNDVDPHYPSSYDIDTIISVASTEEGGNLSGFSCYGAESVDVAAPGSRILSTTPGNKYEFLSGTSMATPHVSGLAALVWMYRPNLDVLQVKKILLETAVKTHALKGFLETGAQVNAFQALIGADEAKVGSAPMHNAMGIKFVDVDGDLGHIGGEVTILAAADESDVGYYKIFITSAGGFPLAVLGEIPAAGDAKYTFEINGSMPIPEYAAFLRVVTGNSTGEINVWNPTNDYSTLVALSDYVVPAYGPRDVAWGGDTCLKAGCLAGELSVERAVDEKTITAYNVHWRISDGDADFRPLVGSIPAIGFKSPTCEGAVCAEFDVQTLPGGGQLYSHTNYGNYEAASITFSGPATVKLLDCWTEAFYDYLLIAGTPYSGNSLRHGETLEVKIPAGLSQIIWYSDMSENGGHWAFELTQEETHASFEVPEQLPLGDSLEVVPVYEENQGEDFVTVSVLDYNEQMPPSPAFAPEKIAWKPTGNVAVVLPPVVNVSRSPVTFYQVDFADKDMNILGGGWRAEVTLSLEMCQETLSPSRTKNDCWLTVPLEGLRIGESGKVCVDVCAQDQCRGSWTNPIPVGEKWEVTGTRSSGCCATPFPGWGSCNTCCKPTTVADLFEDPSLLGTVSEDGFAIPPEAAMLVARAGNEHGLGAGMATMEFEMAGIGELGAKVSQKADAPKLRGTSRPDLPAVVKADEADAMGEDDKQTATTPIAAGEAQKPTDPWLLRLGSAALAKKAAFTESKAKLSPDRIVGFVDIHGWEAPATLPDMLPAALEKALAAAIGDEQASLLTTRIVGTSDVPAEEDATAGTRLKVEFLPKALPVKGEKTRSSPAPLQHEGARRRTRMLLDNLEAKLAAIAMGGPLKTELDEAVTAALMASNQPVTADGVNCHIEDVRQARSAASSVVKAALSWATASLPAEFYP